VRLTSTFPIIEKVKAEVDARKGILAVFAISFAAVAARVVYSMMFLIFVEGCIVDATGPAVDSAHPALYI
jgi:hypothetical protein